MTVLQKAIDRFKRDLESLRNQKYRFSGHSDKVIQLQTNINLLTSLLPEEEKQIREAWEAAASFECANDRERLDVTQYPDLDTYITNLKKQ